MASNKEWVVSDYTLEPDGSCEVKFFIELQKAQRITKGKLFQKNQHSPIGIRTARIYNLFIFAE